MKKLFLFIAPRRNSSIEDYELNLLFMITDKFNLGELKEYGRWTEGNINFIYARFTNGSVKVRYVEGKESVALIRIRKSYLNKKQDFS